ncbi:ty3-gypsy retrotransposon protein [Tanacetum coccineum]
MNLRRCKDYNGRRSEDEELGNPFFEGDCSSSNEWGDYDVAGDDYEGAPVFNNDYEEALVFNDDQFKEESMPVYDTDIEDVIEEEEGFVGKGGFSEEEENMEDIVVVANDLCSSMIQTTLSVDFSKTINPNPHELIWSILHQYDYEISYKKGSENIIADALSRVECSVMLNSLALSTITSDLLHKIKDSYEQDSVAEEKIQQLTNGTYNGDKYTWDGYVLRRKGKIIMLNDELLRTIIIKHFHANAVGGHSGTNVRSHKTVTLFYWKGMHKGVKRFIRECDICQRQNPDLSAYPGYFQPLPIPEKVWSEVSMDFIVGLPMSQGKTFIFMVVDRLDKYAHFMALSYPYIASSVA